MSLINEVQKVETEYSKLVQLIRDNPKRSVSAMPFSLSLSCS